MIKFSFLPGETYSITAKKNIIKKSFICDYLNTIIASIFFACKYPISPALLRVYSIENLYPVKRRTILCRTTKSAVSEISLKVWSHIMHSF